MMEAIQKADPLGPLYIITEPFDAGRGDEWEKYVAWSGLSQVSEIVSLDPMLCPTVLDEILDEDWPHIVRENFMLNYFIDLDYLLKRVGPLSGKNLLCVFRNPQHPPKLSVSPIYFGLLGYDLVDVTGGASPLTNCGGFPDVFSNAELNSCGLVATLERAFEIQRALYARYKGQDHSQCHVWAIARGITPAPPPRP